MRRKLSAQEPQGQVLRPSSPHKGDLFAPEGQGAGNKIQRQETEEEGEGKGNKERGRGICPRGQRTVERQTRQIRQMAVDKRTRGKPVLDEMLNFNLVRH